MALHWHTMGLDLAAALPLRCQDSDYSIGRCLCMLMVRQLSADGSATASDGEDYLQLVVDAWKPLVILCTPAMALNIGLLRHSIMRVGKVLCYVLMRFLSYG